MSHYNEYKNKLIGTIYEVIGNWDRAEEIYEALQKKYTIKEK